MSNEDLPRLEKRDLRRFDGEAQQLLLWAQDRGARIKITKKGHALVFAPNGESTTVPPNLKSGNRSAQNTRSYVRRLFKEK